MPEKIPEVKLNIKKIPSRIGIPLSEVDYVKTLDTGKQEKIIQNCKDDLDYVEAKYNAKKDLPEWQSPERAEKLRRMYLRFKKRRNDILDGLGVEL